MECGLGDVIPIDGTVLVSLEGEREERGQRREFVIFCLICSCYGRAEYHDLQAGSLFHYMGVSIELVFSP